MVWGVATELMAVMAQDVVAMATPPETGLPQTEKEGRSRVSFMSSHEHPCGTLYARWKRKRGGLREKRSRKGVVRWVRGGYQLFLTQRLRHPEQLVTVGRGRHDMTLVSLITFLFSLFLFSLSVTLSLALWL